MQLVVVSCADPDRYNMIAKIVMLVEDDVSSNDLEQDERITDQFVDATVELRLPLPDGIARQLRDAMGDDRPYIG